MKVKLLLMSLLLMPLFIACGVATTLKSNYRAVTSIETATSYDEVWNRVVNFFAMNNLPINVLEKDSGIIAANINLIGEPYVTVEDKLGQPENPKAWFVMPDRNQFLRGKVSFSFNVRVQKMVSGITRININIGNIVGYRSVKVFFMYTFTEEWEKSPVQCASTGILESELLNLFK